MKHLITLSASILLSATSSAQFSDAVLGLSLGGVPEAGDGLGTEIVTGDFNGDGYMDQAMGLSRENLGSKVDAGAVNVVYGSQNGLGTFMKQFWHQDSPGVPGVNESHDRFGAALAVGDFNGDGYHDLAIGAPGEGIGSIAHAGCVTILYGSWLGLKSSGAKSIHQNSAGIAGVSEVGDAMGVSLAAGDFNNDGKDDLAIGVPGEDIDNKFNPGMIHVLKGSSSGLTSAGSKTYHQNSSGVPGVCENFDSFGFALAVGDLDGNGRDDLVVTVPFEGVGLAISTGIAHIFRGSSSGLVPTSVTLHQTYSPLLVPLGDTYAETGDHFGWSVACGDLNGDGNDDVVIGSPHENRDGSFLNGDFVALNLKSGVIDVFTMSGSSSFSVSKTEQFGQWRSWIPGIAEHFDEFGSVLAIGDVDGDQCEDIVVGVPREDIGSLKDAGMVHIFFGNPQGFYSFNSKSVRQPSSGIPGVGPGVVSSNIQFGAGLAIGDFDGDYRSEISIGMPGKAISTGGSSTAAGAGRIQVYELTSSRSIQFRQNWNQ